MCWHPWANHNNRLRSIAEGVGNVQRPYIWLFVGTSPPLLDGMNPSARMYVNLEGTHILEDGAGTVAHADESAPPELAYDAGELPNAGVFTTADTSSSLMEGRRIPSPMEESPGRDQLVNWEA